MSKLLIVGIALFVVLCLALAILVLADQLARARQKARHFERHAQGFFEANLLLARECRVAQEELAAVVLAKRSWTLKDLEREL